jgi:hypothetical protein
MTESRHARPGDVGIIDGYELNDNGAWIALSLPDGARALLEGDPARVQKVLDQYNGQSVKVVAYEGIPALMLLSHNNLNGSTDTPPA